MASILTEDSSTNNEGSSRGNKILSQYNKVIDLSILTLKVAILINGGAAIATLTLIGGILTSGHSLDVVTLLTWAMLCFGFGVLFAAIAVGLGYLSEYFDFQSNLSVYRAQDVNDRSREFAKNLLSLGEQLSQLCEKNLKNARMLVYGSFTLFGIGVVFCALALLCN